MLKRYFIRLAYNGSSFCGWQIQPHSPSVQELIQEKLSTLYNIPAKVVGCGRTDTGVHASDYYLHTDLREQFAAEELRYKLDKMLPPGVSIMEVREVDTESHARFDAFQRSYVYKMVFRKDPFRQDTVYRFDQAGVPDFEKMNKAAALLLKYESFFPFCKTHADSETYDCKLTVSEWQKQTEGEWHYHVTSDRFLRGMVRMIVGMTLNVGLDRLALSEVKKAMDAQERLIKAWSVPAKGLYLSEIKYPFL